MSKRIQIVRVDNDLVQKANLQIGNNIIGRAVATGCKDSQVLKHAVTISLSPNDEMTITPMAPCYMKSAGCVRWQSLKLGNSVPIKPGDVCSLLPDKCWFKIISTPNIMEENDQKLKRKADEDLNNEADYKKACLSSSVEAVVSPSETLNNSLDDKDLLNEQIAPINGNREHNDATVPVLQEIYSASSPEGNDMHATCSKMSIDYEPQYEPSIEHENGEKRKTNNVNSTSETAINESERKVRLDREAHFSDQIEAAAPIKHNSRSPIIARQDQARATKSARVSRERCEYGARCYRENPNHKNNYSHPADSDYDEIDDREECPYGVKCYRKNPQHKAQFKHTTVPRHRRRTTTAVLPVAAAVDTTSETDASSAEESVDESDYAPSVNTESSDDWNDSGNEWEDGTTG